MSERLNYNVPCKVEGLMVNPWVIAQNDGEALVECPNCGDKFALVAQARYTSGRAWTHWVRKDNFGLRPSAD